MLQKGHHGGKCVHAPEYLDGKRPGVHPITQQKQTQIKSKVGNTNLSDFFDFL